MNRIAEPMMDETTARMRTRVRTEMVGRLQNARLRPTAMAIIALAEPVSRMAHPANPICRRYNETIVPVFRRMR